MDVHFQELLNIFDEEKFIFKGLTAYILSNEEEPYKLYKLNMSTHDDIMDIIDNNISNAKDAQIYKYSDNPSPDGNVSLSVLREKDVPEYNQLKSIIIQDSSTVLSKRAFKNMSSNIKGSVFSAVFYNKSIKEEFEILIYSTINKGNLYQAKSGFYRFNDSGQTDILQKSKDSYLSFNKKCCAINYNDYIYIFNGYNFENLFKYEEHINLHSTKIVSKIASIGLISNYSILEDHCNRNKNFKKKLYSISVTNRLNNVNFEVFKNLKNSIGDGLLFTIDEDEKNISIDEHHSYKSVDQIIRIINDETAETIVSKTRIFAHQRIKIK